MTNRPTETDLEWLNATLFTRPGFEPEAHGEYLALPNTSALRRLIPRDPVAGAGAFAKSHDAMGKRRLAAGKFSQKALRRGLGRVARLRALGLPPELGLDGNPEHSVLARLGLAVPAARHCAITLGPRRYNRKPVVELLDERGTAVAYAKVACDDVTETLVANEATMLARAAARSTLPLAVPALLATLDWNGRPIAVIAAARPDRHQPATLDRERLQSLTLAIAAIDEITERSVAELAGTDELGSAIAARFGDATVSAGAWHGDLTPWNTISDSTKTWVLDWEFAGHDAPVGADLLHHHVMTATHLDGTDPSAALLASERTVVRVTDSLGQPSDPFATWALYLLALVRRDRRLRQWGADHDPLGGAAELRLRQLLAPEA